MLLIIFASSYAKLQRVTLLDPQPYPMSPLDPHLIVQFAVTYRVNRDEVLSRLFEDEYLIHQSGPAVG